MDGECADPNISTDDSTDHVADKSRRRRRLAASRRAESKQATSRDRLTTSGDSDRPSPGDDNTAPAGRTGLDRCPRARR